MESKIWIILGSASDLPAFEQARETLKKFEIPYELKVISAHRTPKLLEESIQNMPKSVDVLIAGAGGAAHLPGVVAALTEKPVIGVPMTSAINGFDSLLSIAQMPAGVSVATMAIGKAGATNAVLLATQILGLKEQKYADKIHEHRLGMIRKIEKANEDLQSS